MHLKMMNQFSVVLFLTLFIQFSTINPVQGQFTTSVDSVYTFIKSNSIHRNSADWNKIDKQFQENIRNARSIRDTLNCFVFVLEKLNDVHSQIYFKNQYYGHYPSFADTILVKLKPLTELANFYTNKILTRFLTNKIAYVQVPSIQISDPLQINSMAKSLYDSVHYYLEHDATAFILDLRLNGGGNLYPMLSGLSAILGDGIIAFETDIRDSIARIWEIKNGNFWIAGYQTTQLNKLKYHRKGSKLPVVILLGPVTRSSGSMTAIAFKNRPHTLFLGEQAASGYTSSNGFFQFSPELMMNFATNFVADRYFNIYKLNVLPDIIITEGDNFDNLLEDKKINAAIELLTKGKI